MTKTKLTAELAQNAEGPLRRSVLETREGDGPSVSSSGGGAPRELKIISRVLLIVSMIACARASAAQETHLLVITGISGDEAPAAQYHQLATRFIDAAKKKDAVPDANVIYLAEKTEVDPSRITGRSTKEGIEKAFADLAAKARSKKLLPDDVQGGTFTITNPGGYGTFHGTPVISQPQAGILGTYAIVKRPWVITDDNGADAIAIRSMMNLTLTYDHRLVDGAYAGRFLRDLRERLQTWGESDY